jgi:hypothetical protein
MMECWARKRGSHHPLPIRVARDTESTEKALKIYIGFMYWQTQASLSLPYLKPCAAPYACASAASVLDEGSYA